MDFTRFKAHYLLHDRGTPDDVQRLADIMASKVGSDIFKVPQPPYEFKEDASAAESYKWLSSYFIPETPVNSVVFGFGLGGLLACKLQEDYPARNLSVVAVNAPLSEGDIALADSVAPGRVALYSSHYKPIMGTQCNWPRATPQAYDLPWLAQGLPNSKYGIAYLLTAFMNKEDISREVASFFDAAPERKAVGA